MARVAAKLARATKAARTSLLTVLAQGRTKFGDLVARTGIEAHRAQVHLAQLMRDGLVRRRSHGVYERTAQPKKEQTDERRKRGDPPGAD